MTVNSRPSRRSSSTVSSFLHGLSGRWEILFFLSVCILLLLQVFFFNLDIKSISEIHAAVAAFAAFESFVANRLTYVLVPAIFFPLICLLCLAKRPTWERKFLDALGIYVISRMIIQLTGLNILVFDSVTSPFLLISQLLFFLPYSLLVWGWIYWRLDTLVRERSRPLFHLDCESEKPRPIDYFVASFSSVFSASISAIKGKSARARILILCHGFLIYDVMGLTLSRAVALVQSR